MNGKRVDGQTKFQRAFQDSFGDSYSIELEMDDNGYFYNSGKGVSVLLKCIAVCCGVLQCVAA